MATTKKTVARRPASKVAATKKKPRATTASRARKGERLLITCAPLVNLFAIESLAETLHGTMLVDETDGRYLQVVAVRIDERARKIYGTTQEMYEAAPFMFAPR